MFTGPERRRTSHGLFGSVEVASMGLLSAGESISSFTWDPLVTGGASPDPGTAQRRCRARSGHVAGLISLLVIFYLDPERARVGTPRPVGSKPTTGHPRPWHTPVTAPTRRFAESAVRERAPSDARSVCSERLMIRAPDCWRGAAPQQYPQPNARKRKRGASFASQPA